MRVVGLVLGLLLGAVPGPVQAKPPPAQEAAHRRQTFYIGGQYVSNGNGQSVWDGQIYVEYLVSTKKKPKDKRYPLIFFHGAGGTGAVWLNTPDGRKGWASYYLERGHEVYIVDLYGVGRSGRRAAEATRDSASAEVIERVFTVPEDDPFYPQAVKHDQWPGTGKKGDPIFDAFYRSFVPVFVDQVAQQNTMRQAGAALLQTTGPAVLVGHSLGGYFPWIIADAAPALVKGIVNIEPAGPPFRNLQGPGSSPARPYGLTDAPITYDPPVQAPSDLSTVEVGQDTPESRSCILQTNPPRKLANISRVPVLIVTGEASFHAPFEQCIVDFLRQAGVRTTWLELGRAGIEGHGHFLFIENDNLAIAKRVEKWIKKPN